MKFRLLCSIALLSMGVACGGTEDPGPPTLTRVQAEVFDVSCTSSTCHSTATQAGGLDLTSGNARAQLVDVAAANMAAAQMNLVRVRANDSANSFLVTKLKAPVAAGFGDVMPIGNPSGLDATRLALVEAWINAGAQDN